MSEKLIIQQINDLVSAELHQRVWAVTMSRNWYFGNQSRNDVGVPFWRMELDGIPAVDEVWEASRSRCEDVIGRPLKVLTQYANGHTYGQGGLPHQDDTAPGTYTLLYYPMLEWQPMWEGETIFRKADGEVIAVVIPIPNRAVFFDSRIPHSGRAPSRIFGGLRVTIAFKLAVADGTDPPS